jgi:hypothetical protein
MALVSLKIVAESEQDSSYGAGLREHRYFIDFARPDRPQFGTGPK